jgi:hypothetical protein
MAQAGNLCRRRCAWPIASRSIGPVTYLPKIRKRLRWQDTYYGFQMVTDGFVDLVIEQFGNLVNEERYPSQRYCCDLN